MASYISCTIFAESFFGYICSDYCLYRKKGVSVGISEVFKAEIRKAIGTENLLTSTEALSNASKDETHGLPPSLPDAVLRAKSHDDVVSIAQICARHGVVMTPRGAGTGKSGGCVPVNGGVVVDFSLMNRILSVNETDLIAVVEPGVVLGEFQRHVEALNLYYPPDPASLDWCTIGGNVAENAGGPSAVKYGVTRDYVLGLKIVLADGTSFQIGKNTIKGVTGLDLVSLICGSEGTLAFITEITLRILPKPKFARAALLQFSSREHALERVSCVRKFGVKCLEFIDSSSIGVLRSTGLLGDLAANTMSILLVEVDGPDEEQLFESLLKLDASLKDHGYLGALVSRDERERQKIWGIRRNLSTAIKASARYKVSEDVVVPLSKMNALLDDVSEIATRFGVTTCAFGHAGDGNLHLQFLFNDQSIYARIPELLKDVFSTTVGYNGTITGEHGIGIAKMPYLEIEQEKGLIELQQRLKAVFDPSGILNPGKFV